jgi:hypothetical protein
MARDARGIKHVIHPAAVYSQEAVRLALGLKTATLQREIRLGRLRVAKRAGRYYILGSWLLEWVEKGEVQRRNRQAEFARGPDFLRLANALSALYPNGSEEKRLLDAMLLAVPR